MIWNCQIVQYIFIIYKSYSVFIIRVDPVQYKQINLHPTPYFSLNYS